MNKNESFRWSVLPESTVQAKESNENAAILGHYRGMDKPIQISDNEYQVKITIKYFYKINQQWVVIESITHAIVDCDKQKPLFLNGNDIDDIQVLSFMINEILIMMDKCWEINPILNQKRKPSDFDTPNTIASNLLLSRPQWLN